MTLKPNAWPPPPPYIYPLPPVYPILPIYPPPSPLSHPLPSLPSPPHTPSFSATTTSPRTYKLTTHLIPAAYLRSTRYVPIPEPPPADASKEERRSVLKRTREELDSMRTTKVTDGYPRMLWNCVNRYVRVGGRGKGLTLFFAHANGFPKEIFEPTIGHLLSSPDAANIVDEIWVWESIQHGDSALVNAANVSALFDWHDNARDILNFLLYFLPSPSSADSQSALPTHLPRVPEHITQQRVRTGFTGADLRRFVAVGHSYGGCTSALAATIYPSLFTALYLIDPVVLEPRYASDDATGLKLERSRRPDLAMGALSRRDVWDTREQAHASFLASPFFRAWDPEVLKVYVECGLCLSPSPSSPSPSPSLLTTQLKATLKTPPALEASVFAEIHTEHEVFHLISTLPSSVAIRWCMPGKPGAPQLGFVDVEEGERGVGRRVWVRRGTEGGDETTNARIMGGGHLIPQEAPKELAEDLGAYLVHMWPRWIQSKQDADESTSQVHISSSSLSGDIMARKANL